MSVTLPKKENAMENNGMITLTKAEMLEEWKKRKGFYSGVRSCDVEREDEAYQGAYFVNANSTTAPQIVDRSVQPILDRNEVYSGCYARVSINFYAFNSNGNRGVACGLGNIQKVRDGEPLGGKSSAANDFTTDLDDDFLS